MDFHLVAAGRVKTLPKVQSSSNEASNPLDAYFTSSAGLGALGVASGSIDCQPASQDHQVTPIPYAPALIRNCSTAFLTAITPKPGNTPSKHHAIDPAYILAHAQQATRQAGSAAVALAALQPGGKLCVSNLGNCKVLLLRDGQVWEETEEQFHTEEFGGVGKAYQMGHPNFAKGCDSIHDAARYLWDVKAGDIIISGTDTFFNNIKTPNILYIASKTLKTSTSPATAATPQKSNPASGLERVTSVLRRHTSGGGAPKPDTTAAASPGSSSSSPGSSRGPSPEPKIEGLGGAVAHAADVLASAAAEHLIKRKNKAAAATAAAAEAAAADSVSKKGSIFARLKKQTKALPKQQVACTLKDDIACVVAVVTSNAAAVTAAAALDPTPTAELSCGSVASEGTAHQSPITVGSTSSTTADEEVSCNEVNPFATPPSHITASTDSSSSSSCKYRGPSEAESTSKLLKVSSTKGPGSKSGSEISPASSDQIRVYHNGVYQAEMPKNKHLIPAGWMGPELGDSPSKVKLEARRTASAKLLSAAAAAAAAAAASSRAESPSGSYAGRQMQRMRSIQNSYNQPGYSGYNRSSRSDHLPPTQQQQQQQQHRSRRATVGAYSSNSCRTSSNRSDRGANYSSHMQGHSSSSSSRRSEVTYGRRLSSSSNLTALMGLPPTPASTISDPMSRGSDPQISTRPTAAAAATAVDPATAVLAGMDGQGRQLYVGCLVVVETEAGVAAVGTVKLVTGQQLNKWEPEKVSPGHVGVGDIRIEPSMESAARQTRFWVKCESFKLYGNHPDYTFWTRRSALQKGINVSIPCSSLRLVE